MFFKSIQEKSESKREKFYIKSLTFVNPFIFINYNCYKKDNTQRIEGFKNGSKMYSYSGDWFLNYDLISICYYIAFFIIIFTY